MVGFTAASDQADPEDVRARLLPYHTQLRRVIESHGGTVEKFVGDAVMAVFGAPVAHEDDAERAVRAGLRILEGIEELNRDDARLQLKVRVGINTGEAIVAVGAHPERGEGFVTGDVVNTASRLQGIAPVNGVAVSETTHEQTSRLFLFTPLESVQVKGKAETLVVWQPVAPRARYGADVVRSHATPLVGRELERPLLIAAFERAIKQRACQLVTVIGEPGVGKTRLCTELLHYVEQRPGLVRWRQGRCLPYGEGIAFWALGEIVKAECGILESDPPEAALAKLDDAIPPEEPDRSWLIQRLAPLVGAGGEPAAQEESFTAWRRFLEGLAAQTGTVLVFEDLHWADDAMLAFLEHVADWSESVPLLVLSTARPELHEKHPAWAAGLRNAQTINLAPLSDDETATLIALLMQRTVLPAATERALLDRAGGNPLYAEEFVRLLSDRNLLPGPLDEVPFPDSVQSLIAARLDTLTPDHKSLLQDAAVVGKVFWAGALAVMGKRDPREVDLALRDLARKGLIRPARLSSMQGEQEYGFWHLIVRDVCYAQIPRRTRAARHIAAATWVEEQAGERADDLADVLAHHHLQALELARAAGDEQETRELESSARRYLALAGERALAIDLVSAERSFAKALDLAPTGNPERAPLLERWAQAAQQLGRHTEAVTAVEEALVMYREKGATVATARALTTLSNLLGDRGDPRREETIAEALRLLADEPPGPELVRACAQVAGLRSRAAAYGEAIDAADRALRLAADLRLPEPARALGYRGYAAALTGEARGLEDMRRALDLALEYGNANDAAVLYNNLALATGQYQALQAALDVCDEGIAFCERHGISTAPLIGGTKLSFQASAGRWDDALAAMQKPNGEADASHSDAFNLETQSVRLGLTRMRGENYEPQAAAQLVAAARNDREPQALVMALTEAAQAVMAGGQTAQTKALLEELAQTSGTRDDPYYAAHLPGLVRSALAANDPALAARLILDVEPRTPLQQHALITCRAALAEAAGEHASAAALYADAVARWRAFDALPELALALLGQGRSLLALHASGAEVPLNEAHGLLAAMGYMAPRIETEELLQQASAPAS
ncbi:MAG: AAA family ATPase [Candidatus Dormibacteraeota bacterium]|nr:AAA family ATPase [Candidatus Dormibacteraeota bacterium]